MAVAKKTVTDVRSRIRNAESKEKERMDFTEQELLIDRLDNWGRVYGERRAPGWRSSLLGVLREVGYQQEVPF